MFDVHSEIISRVVSDGTQKLYLEKIVVLTSFCVAPKGKFLLYFVVRIIEIVWTVEYVLIGIVNKTFWIKNIVMILTRKPMVPFSIKSSFADV